MSLQENGSNENRIFLQFLLVVRGITPKGDRR
jgi:hypothetical protein